MRRSWCQKNPVREHMGHLVHIHDMIIMQTIPKHMMSISEWSSFRQVRVCDTCSQVLLLGPNAAAAPVPWMVINSTENGTDDENWFPSAGSTNSRVFVMLHPSDYWLWLLVTSMTTDKLKTTPLTHHGVSEAFGGKKWNEPRSKNIHLHFSRIFLWNVQSWEEKMYETRLRRLAVRLKKKSLFWNNPTVGSFWEQVI